MKTLEKIFRIEKASSHCDPLPGASWIYLFYCITSNEPESLGQWSPGLYKLGSFSTAIAIIYDIVNIISRGSLSHIYLPL